jgi:hypothetical protein
MKAMQAWKYKVLLRKDRLLAFQTFGIRSQSDVSIFGKIELIPQFFRASCVFIHLLLQPFNSIAITFEGVAYLIFEIGYFDLLVEERQEILDFEYAALTGQTYNFVDVFALQQKIFCYLNPQLLLQIVVFREISVGLGQGELTVL